MTSPGRHRAETTPGEHPAYRLTLGRVLRSEWIKLRSLRGTWLGLGALLLLMVGLGVLAAAFSTGTVSG
ncbi:MAG: ABC transporter permease, partial [Lapillicoccus sp.]